VEAENFTPLPGEVIAEKAEAVREGQPLGQEDAIALAESALHYAAEASLVIAAEKQRLSVVAAQRAFRSKLAAEAAALGIPIKKLHERRSDEKLRAEAKALGISVAEAKRRRAAEKRAP